MAGKKKKSVEKRGPGRPSTFNEKFAAILLKLAEDGKTYNQMAEIMGVHVNTIRNWLAADGQLLDAIKNAKTLADDIVEASLFERAKGYSFESEKIFCTKDGEIVRAKTVQHCPPDPTAMIFWLKNRQPDKWREKSEHDHNVNQPIVVKIADDEKDL